MMKHRDKRERSGRARDEPNWPGSMWDSTTGFRAFSITKLSAIFDMVEVSEIGRRSVLKSETIGALGSGGTSASFHTRGTLTSEKEAFKMTAMGAARISAYSLGPSLECRLGHSHEEC